MAKSKLQLTIFLQCGGCGAIVHGDSAWEAHFKGEQGPVPPKFCPRCSAAFERYCLKCKKRVPMFFEEWWPGDEECVRTYTPAKKCPHCNAGLDVGRKHGAKDGPPKRLVLGSDSRR